MITGADLLDKIKKFTTDKTMQLNNGKYTMHLEIDEDTYWGLIKLGAEIKTDCETYAEHILLGHVQSELDQQATD
jgi:hypothetical protein